MNRTVVMTLGFLLVFFGIQLNVVDTYVLTPRMANFLSDQLPDQQNQIQVAPNATAASQQQPFVQAGYASNQPGYAVPQTGSVSRTIQPPGWLGWPIMFLGAVFFLNGLSIRQ
jgi:hypothetical protein